MRGCCWQLSPKERLKAPEVVDLLREMRGFLLSLLLWKQSEPTSYCYA